MWFFRSPKIVFGENALSHLDEIAGHRVFIVTDEVMVNKGYVRLVQDRLKANGMESSCFAQVEPEPGTDVVDRCAQAMLEFGPDWVIGLGGGSSLDAAKAAWLRYERPDVDLEAVSPFEYFGLGKKARLITIPTTAGSGAEVTAAAMIIDRQTVRKLEIASFEMMAAVTIVDPQLSAEMPAQLTADTGIDVLTHSIEGYSGSWSNDFSDGLCLQATWMVFQYLERAVSRGAEDMEAREKMANAATIAALGMTNSHIALAHALGHSVGAVSEIPHGRITGLFLPYTIEFTAFGGVGRYLELSRILGLCGDDEKSAGFGLADSIRSLLRRIGQPTTLFEAGISRVQFDTQVEDWCERVEAEISLATSRRVPFRQELLQIFDYAFDGKVIDF
jgi:alcohol dehydrogenase class IV